MSLREGVFRGNRWPRAPVPPTARAALSVDLVALRANWARLNAASGRAECAGVIKADAYGLGLAPIAKALTSEGCKTFFVATIEEGRAARAVGGTGERGLLLAPRPALTRAAPANRPRAPSRKSA